MLSLSSKVNPNSDLPAAFIPLFRRIFLMANAMKIHLKKNAAANGLELKERLQGLTATNVTHSYKSKAAILIIYIWSHKYCENSPSSIINYRLPINSRNKTGISAPSDQPIYLENIINRKGEKFSSFVKLNLASGRSQHSKTPDVFNERQAPTIPAEVDGHLLSAQKRANLQDRKAILVTDMKVPNGKPFDSYI